MWKVRMKGILIGLNELLMIRQNWKQKECETIRWRDVAKGSGPWTSGKTDG